VDKPKKSAYFCRSGLLWNLKFNSNKSKVLVVGKRIDKSNKWVLGDTYIEEIPWSIFLSFS
jgi:hypothetical protein